MVARTDPNLTDKLATMIALYFGIPRDHLKTMSREQIIALAVWDHDPVPVAVAKANGWGPLEYNHPSNLTPRLAEDHQIKTATKDVPEIAKSDRISEAHQDFQRRILAKTGQAQETEAPSKRKYKWGTRKIQSRGFRKDVRHDRS